MILHNIEKLIRLEGRSHYLVTLQRKPYSKKNPKFEGKELFLVEVAFSPWKGGKNPIHVLMGSRDYHTICGRYHHDAHNKLNEIIFDFHKGKEVDLEKTIDLLPDQKYEEIPDYEI